MPIREPEGWEAQLSERRIKPGQVSTEQAGPLSFERQVTCAMSPHVVLRVVPPLTAVMVNVAAPGTFDGGKTIPLAFSVICDFGIFCNTNISHKFHRDDLTQLAESLTERGASSYYHVYSATFSVCIFSFQDYFLGSQTQILEMCS